MTDAEQKLLHALGLGEGASPVEVLRRLMDFGVPLTLLKEGPEAVLVHMERYGPLVEISWQEMMDFLEALEGQIDPRWERALKGLKYLLALREGQGVFLPRNLL